MTNVVSCDTAILSGGLTSVKARQQAMWASGDFAVIGNTLQIVGCRPETVRHGRWC